MPSSPRPAGHSASGSSLEVDRMIDPQINSTPAPAGGAQRVTWRHYTRGVCLALALVGVAHALARPASSQQPDELPEYLQALGYLAWDEGADVEKRGVVHFESERTAAGYNLHTNDVDQIYLSDLSGKHVHTWRVPPDVFKTTPKQCEYATLLSSGQLAVVCVNQGITILDWDSNAAYSARGLFHHDVVEQPDGRLLAPATTSRIEYAGRKVEFDGLVVFSLEGRGGEVWSSHARLAELKEHHPPLLLDTPPSPAEPEPESTLKAKRKAERKAKRKSRRKTEADLSAALTEKTHDYYHLNSVQLLPETELGSQDSRFQAGNKLISLRNANLVLILDRDDQRVVWSYGPGKLELQHAPSMLANGNILLFDNGTHRGYSRVIELAPKDKTIVWEYRGKPEDSFFSKWRGIAQRLDNGNTLITESERGHVFEVTQAGQVVWDFWNPEIEDGKRKRIYRMIRFDPDWVEALLKAKASSP